MRCSCCGNEVREDERYCKKCGQNNEGYVKEKPIERVELYSQPNNVPTYTFPQNVYQQPNLNQVNCQAPKAESGITTAAKVFIIIGAVLMAISTYLIALAWCIPMIIHYFNTVKRGQAVSTGFKVCALLFVSLLGGVLMLCDKEH